MRRELQDTQQAFLKEALETALKDARGLGMDRGGIFGTSAGWENKAKIMQGVRIGSFITMTDDGKAFWVDISGNTAESHKANEAGEFPPQSIPALLKKAGFDLSGVQLVNGGNIGHASAAGWQLTAMTWKIDLASLPAAVKQKLDTPKPVKAPAPTPV